MTANQLAEAITKLAEAISSHGKPALSHDPDIRLWQEGKLRIVGNQVFEIVGQKTDKHGFCYNIWECDESVNYGCNLMGTITSFLEPVEVSSVGKGIIRRERLQMAGFLAKRQ